MTHQEHQQGMDQMDQSQTQFMVRPDAPYRARPGIPLLTCLAVVVLSAMPTAGQPEVNRRHTETSLGPFPTEVHDSALISHDGRHVAYVQQNEGGQRVVLDGQPGRTRDRATALAFGEGGRLAYAASSDGKWFLVDGEREHGPFTRVGPPQFSHDGARLAFIALTADDKRTVVVDGQPGRPYDVISAGLLQFSPDGGRLAYGAVRQGECYLVVDGRELGPFQDLGTRTGYVFSADGARLAFVAMVDDRLSVVIDGQMVAPCHDVGNLVFNSDGSRLAYAFQDEPDGKWSVAVDGKSQTPYDTIGDDTLGFSPDGSRLAYAASSGGKWRVVVDGVESPDYASVAEIRFSPDGRSLAYVVGVPGGERVVLDGQEQTVYDAIGGGSLAFSPGAGQLAYIARTGRARFVVLDGARKRRFDMVGYLSYTPDGRHTVYAAIRDGQAFTVVDDRRAAHRYDSIWTPPAARFLFDHRDEFRYLAVKDGAIHMVTEKVQ